MNPVIVICAALGVAVWFLLRETFREVDRKWRLYGKSYESPLGPKGVPIFGNLFQFVNARKPGRLTPYVNLHTPHSHPESKRECANFYNVAFFDAST